MAVTVGRSTYESTGAREAGEKTVNQIAIYSMSSENKEGEITATLEHSFLDGLNILKIDTNRTARLTTHPMENGQLVADNKVIEPTKISISAICDNKRSVLEFPKEDENKKTLLSSLKKIGEDLRDEWVSGKEYKGQEQTISSLAKIVYAKLEKMLTEKEWIVYSIATKGAIYNDMMLTGIDQLNDPEHLMVIPVTLRFEECILPGEDSVKCAKIEDVDIKMSGSKQEKSILDSLKESITDSINNGLSFLGLK